MKKTLIIAAVSIMAGIGMAEQYIKDPIFQGQAKTNNLNMGALSITNVTDVVFAGPVSLTNTLATLSAQIVSGTGGVSTAFSVALSAATNTVITNLTSTINSATNAATTNLIALVNASTNTLWTNVYSYLSVFTTQTLVTAIATNSTGGVTNYSTTSIIFYKVK